MIQKPGHAFQRAEEQERVFSSRSTTRKTVYREWYKINTKTKAGNKSFQPHCVPVCVVHFQRSDFMLAMPLDMVAGILIFHVGNASSLLINETRTPSYVPSTSYCLLRGVSCEFSQRHQMLEPLTDQRHLIQSSLQTALLSPAGSGLVILMKMRQRK